MADSKDALPSDAERGDLKPVHKDRKDPPPADDKKAEEEPSQQPS